MPFKYCGRELWKEMKEILTLVWDRKKFHMNGRKVLFVP
jgi:hypothetical protein